MVVLIIGAAYSGSCGLSGAFLYRGLIRYVTRAEAILAAAVLAAVWPITLIYYLLALFASAIARKEPS